MLKKKAVQNPSTRKPGTILSTSKTIKALMTKRNKPIVKMVIGIVRMIKRGLIIIFNNAKTAATLSAVRTELT